MSALETLADDLARDVIAGAESLGSDEIIEEIARKLGATSTTMEEAYRTAIRIRLAERRARAVLESRLTRSEQM